MKSVTIAVLCLLVAGFAFAQHTEGTAVAFGVASTVPANLATSVSSSTTTVSITFNDAVDTTMFYLQGKGQTGCIITNFDSLTAVAFSTDHKTVNLTVRLSAAKTYFALVYSAKSWQEVQMAAPAVFYFTTASSFPTTTVSGTVQSGTSGVGTAGSFVALSTTSLQQGDPQFVAGTVSDNAGNFTIPYVPNGTLYPLAAKDVTGDGSIDPSTGDVVGTGNQISVSGTNITGVTITFTSTLPYRFGAALDSLNKYVGTFPNPHVLRAIQGSEVDSLGRASNWEFDYTGTNAATSFMFRLQTFGVQIKSMDTSQYGWVRQSDPITVFPDTAVVDSFLARAERSGGYAYRPKPMSWNGFDVHVNIGNLTMQGYQDMLTDTSKNYLGVTYWYGVQGQNNSVTYGQRRFVGNYSTGAILSTTGIAQLTGVATTYRLEQNYPNPFNPATTIEFSIPQASHVTLAVYNMLGQRVATLADDNVQPGNHQVKFDGSKLSSGVYFYRIEAGSFVQARKLVLLK